MRNICDFIVEYILISDSMLHTVATLTSICEDACDSATIQQNDLKPFNRQLLNEEYLNRSSINNDGDFDNSLVYCPTTNFKQLFRFSHLNVSHSSRSSLWHNLLRQDHIRHQHKFQQAVERYPEDIRYVSSIKINVPNSEEYTMPYKSVFSPEKCVVC
jgi:hypothetical protein